MLYHYFQPRTLDSLSTKQNISTSKPTVHLGITFTDTLQQSLYNCSINMGISEETIVRNQGDFREVYRRVRTFLDEISPLLPEHFIPHLKNPCWESQRPDTRLFNSGKFRESQKNFQYPKKKFANTKYISCLPYFLIAGFPKCGSTTVHQTLSKLRNIVAPAYKEPHWWGRGIYKHRKKFNTSYSFLWYTQIFRPIALKMTGPQHQKLITYDGSQSTLWDSSFFVHEQDYCAVPALVNLILPNVKFIVVMRNPANRLYSDFTFTCVQEYSSNIRKWPHKLRQGSAKIFHNVSEQRIEFFNNCTKTASVFECSILILFNGGSGNIKGCKVRLSIGIYVVHIKKWLQFFPIKNFLFIRMEDLSKHPEDIILSITNFLGIERSPEAISEILKQHKNAHPSGVQPMDSRTLTLLEDFYRPYNEELAHLLNNNSFLWKD